MRQPLDAGRQEKDVPLGEAGILQPRQSQKGTEGGGADPMALPEAESFVPEEGLGSTHQCPLQEASSINTTIVKDSVN